MPGCLVDLPGGSSEDKIEKDDKDTSLSFLLVVSSEWGRQGIAYVIQTQFLRTGASKRAEEYMN